MLLGYFTRYPKGKVQFILGLARKGAHAMAWRDVVYRLEAAVSLGGVEGVRRGE